MLAFLDTETVTLAPGARVIWEVAVIVREETGDLEWVYQTQPDLAQADPVSLRISEFDSRHFVPQGAEAVMVYSPEVKRNVPLPMTHHEVGLDLSYLLNGRHIVGAVPNFDTERLSLYLESLGLSREPWHYHLVDVENLAVGYLRGEMRRKPAHAAGTQALQDLTTPPWDSEELSRAVGVEPPDKKARHTALADARWARDIYDQVMGR